LSELSPLIDQSPAIGEIGLDFHWVEDSSQYPAQLKVLEYFLAAAREQKKIVNLHTKGAEKEILDLLERYDIQRAIVHWYSGPLDILRGMVQFGAYFTIGVELLCSDAIKAIAKEIPDHLLLTETDNPGGLKWLNGIIGLPSDIHKVVDAVAELRNMPADFVVHRIQKNFLHLIEHDPWLQDQRDLLWLPEH
jgi:TatD DNase family protein